MNHLFGTGIKIAQENGETIISFIKTNEEYIIREILRYTGRATDYGNIILHPEIFEITRDEKLSLLKGFCDTTAYIRRSNYFFEKTQHRVYIEIVRNWQMVIDICNLLKSVDIPVQTIDWAHPNIRDGKLTKYNQGYSNFWKKEHQIKIWANEFLPIGFAVIHKKEALEKFVEEQLSGMTDRQIKNGQTHKFYWESTRKNIEKNKPKHPCENDEFIPIEIRGKHFNSWKEIANELGYGE